VVTLVILLIAVVVLSVSLLFSLRNNESLVQEKNTLILQKDSLKVQQIQYRKDFADEGLRG